MKAKNRLFALILCVVVALTLGVLAACVDPSTPTKALDHIELDTSSVKTEFTAGDTLTYEGLSVKAYYDNDTNAIVTGYTVTANNLEAGKLTVSSNKVTVSYTEEEVTKTATYDITVKAGTVIPEPGCSNPDCDCDNCDGTDCDCGKVEPEVKVESIRITKLPTKRVYYVGDTYSTEGLEIEVTYDNDTKETITSGFTAPASTAAAGEDIEVSVIYKGKTDKFTITVYNKLTGLAITGTETYDLGDEFEGVTVKALYNNKTTGGVELEEKDYTLVINPELNEGKFDTIGTYTVTVTYSEEKIDKIEKSENFTITIADPDAIAYGEENEDSIGEWKYWVADSERNWGNTEAEEYCTVTATEVKFVDRASGKINIHAAFSASNNLDYGFQLFFNDTTNYDIGSKYIVTLTIEAKSDCVVVINNYRCELKADEPREVEVEFTYSYNGNYTGLSLFDMQVVVVDGASYDITLTDIQWTTPDPDKAWEFTKVSLVEEDGKVYFVYSGTYANYSEEQLKAILDSSNNLFWDIVYPIGEWPHANVQEGFATTFAMNDGTWTYKTEITVGSLGGYYKVGSFYVNNSAAIANKVELGKSVEVEAESGVYKYELVDGKDYWNTITFQISDVTPAEEIPNEYALEFSGEDAYVGTSRLLGRWVYYHKAEEDGAEKGSKANGSYNNGTLTFNFVENAGDWWCTQLFYKNPEFATDSKHSVKLTLTLTKSGRITVNQVVYELEANVAKTIEFNFTQGAKSTLTVVIGVWGEPSGTIDVEEGTLVISEITFGEWKEETDSNPGPGGEDQDKCLCDKCEPDCKCECTGTECTCHESVGGETPEIQLSEVRSYGEGGGFIWFEGKYASDLIKQGTTTMELVITKNGNPIEANNQKLLAGVIQIQIAGSKYDDVVINITFKEGDKVVATATLTCNGEKELILDENELSIQVGKTGEVFVIKLNGSTDLDGKTIAWSIDGDGIATIPDNSNGISVVITAVATGTATLTCTIDGVKAICVITVVEGEVVEEPPVNVSSQLKENNVYTGGKYGLCINIRYECGADIVGKIADVEVSVTKDGETIPYDIPQKHGDPTNYYVHISVSGDWTHSYVFTINYKNSAGKVFATGTFAKEPAKSVKLDKSSLNFVIGEAATDTVTATITGNIEGTIAWSIDNEQVAKIEVNDGNMSVTVTVVGKGDATITATIGEYSATCKVKVSDAGDESDYEIILSKTEMYGGDMYVKLYMSADDFKLFTDKTIKKVVVNDSYTGDNWAGGFLVDGTVCIHVRLTMAGAASGDYTLKFYDENDNVVAVCYVTV